MVKSHNHPMPHTHTRGTMEITAYFSANSIQDAKNDYGGAINSRTERNRIDRHYNNSDQYCFINYFNASKAWTGSTSQPNNANTSSNNTENIENRPVNYTIKIWKRTA